MTYATFTDIDSRYPGELAQAGPTVDGELDDAAVADALKAADQLINGALQSAGLPRPASPYPQWVKSTAINLALYLATPTVLASQSDFADRRQRYLDACSLLDRIAEGRWLPPSDTPIASPTIYASSKPRVFGRGTL